MAGGMTSPDVYKVVDDDCEQLQVALKKLKMSSESAYPVKKAYIDSAALKHKQEKCSGGNAEKNEDEHPLQHSYIKAKGSNNLSRSICLCKSSVCRLSQSKMGGVTKQLNARKSLLREARLKFLAEVHEKHPVCDAPSQPSISSPSVRSSTSKNEKCKPDLGANLSSCRQVCLLPPDERTVSLKASHSSFTGTSHLVDSFSVLKLAARENHSDVRFEGSYREADASQSSSQALAMHHESPLQSSTPTPAGGGATCTSRQDLQVERSCSQEAHLDEMSVNELAAYFEDFIYIPKKMSSMAEMMYT